jgi:hypothetical protein
MTPSRSSGYHTGNGTPKKRCRLTHQSPDRPFHPVFEPVRHVLGMPLELAVAPQERRAELHRLDEPLTAGDDLERPVTLFVELHRVRNRARVADQIPRLAQQLDDLRARLGDRQVRSWS